MPAHYWIETGDYRAALRSSDRAFACIVAWKVGRTATTRAQLREARRRRRLLRRDDARNYATAKLWAARMALADGIDFDAVTALRFGDVATAYTATDPQYGSPAVHGWAALLLGRKNEAVAIANRIEKTNATGGYVTPLFLALVAEANGDS